MTRYTIDANVIINWLLTRAGDAEQFMGDLTQQDELVAPLVFFPECTSVLREEVFSGRLRDDQAREHLGTLLGLPFSLHGSIQQFRRALDLAARFQHQKAYDMQYVAVSELSSSVLVTGDRGSIHAATEIGITVRVVR